MRFVLVCGEGMRSVKPRVRRDFSSQTTLNVLGVCGWWVSFESVGTGPAPARPATGAAAGGPERAPSLRNRVPTALGRSSYSLQQPRWEANNSKESTGSSKN